MKKRIVSILLFVLLITGCSNESSTGQSQTRDSMEETIESTSLQEITDSDELTFEEYKKAFPGPGKLDEAYQKLKIKSDISHDQLQDLLTRYSWKLEGGGILIFNESGEVQRISLSGQIEYAGIYSVTQDNFYLEPDPASVNYANVIKDHKYRIEADKLFLFSEEVKEHQVIMYPMKKIIP
ncbi:hypothetical protein C6P52_06255 [Enterococcus mundtii]|uniref:hypothetical protein n=1 Tax=Enterococcus mundtii TaxID=53346 RepID=UPI000D38268F|nr:hypothetical protein [Enterococcus mundtii]PTO39067.1 hypothetical protein C6P52_06255 [Enterococcus mundtii]PTO40632.1 hypothetical protein C6P54_14440 [Enterococcus mundtii]